MQGSHPSREYSGEDEAAEGNRTGQKRKEVRCHPHEMLLVQTGTRKGCLPIIQGARSNFAMEYRKPMSCTLLGCQHTLNLQAQAQVQHEVDENTSAKKPRVVWSVEMHQQFVNAVNSLGIDSKQTRLYPLEAQPASHAILASLEAPASSLAVCR